MKSTSQKTCKAETTISNQVQENPPLRRDGEGDGKSGTRGARKAGSQSRSRPGSGQHHVLGCVPWPHCRALLSWCSRVRLCATQGTAAHQAPLSMGFSRQEYWSGCRSLLQGICPTQGSNPGLPHCRQILYRLSHQGKSLNPHLSPALAGGFFTTSATWEAWWLLTDQLENESVASSHT